MPPKTLQNRKPAPRARIREAAQTPATRRQWWVSEWFLCAGLVVLTLAIYGQVLAHPFINYDDEGYVTENAHVKAGLTWQTIEWAFTSTEQANWHPVTWLSHALDCQLFGLNAGAHHLTSLLIHAINVCLLFLLLRRATGEPILSLFVAALFAVHPFNIESVAWIAERKNVLSTTFFLLTLGAYGWYAQRPDWKKYLVVCTTFACGLASKPMLVTLPAVLLLIDYWPLQRIVGWTPVSEKLAIPQCSLRRLLAEKAPLLLLSIASSVITLIAQRAGGAIQPFSLVVKLETALSGYALYLLKAFWPSSFAIYYPNGFDPYLNQHPTAADYFLAALGAALLIVVTIWVWRLRRKRPYLIVGWLWYVGTLVPVIGLVKVGSQGIADRYAYIPLIGIFIALTWGLSDLTRSWKINPRWILAAGAFVLAILSAITFVELSYWQTPLKLFSHAASITRNNLIALDKTAVLLYREGNPDAFRYYAEAARIAPWDAASHEAIAAVADQEGRYKDELQDYEVVIHNSTDPEMVGLAYSNMGVLHARMGDYTQARIDAQQAARLAPEKIDFQIRGLTQFYAQNPTAQGYLKLCLLLDNAGRLPEAKAACKKAAEIEPSDAEVQRALDHLNRE